MCARLLALSALTIALSPMADELDQEQPSHVERDRNNPGVEQSSPGAVEVR
jgi:hypothetical protein